MARKRRVPPKTHAKRAGKSGTGKPLAAARPKAAPARPEPEPRPVSLEELRARVARERDAAIARLQALRVSPEFEESSSPGGNESTLEEGDAAQASERRDMSFTTRERLARRINELTAALERMARGEYGRCSVCGRDIEPERLEAIPETATCLQCQARLERTGAPERAA